MATWRPLDQYVPFAQILVRYMWESRPPLNPNQFAIRAGLRRQILSQWLNAPAAAELHPDPTAVVKAARAMGMPVTDLLIAAGHCTEADPLLDRPGSWAYVLQRIEDAPPFTKGEQDCNQQDLFLDERARQHLLAFLRTLATADEVSHQATIASTASSGATDAPSDTPDTHSEGAAASVASVADTSGDTSSA